MYYTQRIKFSGQCSSIIYFITKTRFTLCCSSNIEPSLFYNFTISSILIFYLKVAIQYPAAVTACNVDLETLITDSNRSIATLAITTLLKTGNEAGVDRLMKQISSFLSEISDQFKTVVVDAIK